MKKYLSLLLLFLFFHLFSFSQVKMSIFSFNDNKINKEIIKLITSQRKLNHESFQFCDLSYVIVDNPEGSAGLPSCEISNDMYIAIKDEEKMQKLPKLYVLKNIFDLKTESIQFSENRSGIILTFESTIATKSKNWKQTLDYDYTKVVNKYKIDFDKIKKLQ